MHDKHARYEPAPKARSQAFGITDLAIREGGRIDIPAGPGHSTFDFVRLALQASWSLDGKPVLCRDILPGVSMWVTTGTSQARSEAETERLAVDIWTGIRPGLIDWLTMRQPKAGVTMTLKSGIYFHFAWIDRARMQPAALHIVVRHERAFLKSYAKHRGRTPLAEPHGVPLDPAADALARTVAVMRGALLPALEKSIQTNEARYARLPAPVRYRLTGALAAWQTFRQVVDAHTDGETLTEAMRTRNIRSLLSHTGNFAMSLLPAESGGRSAPELALHASQSVVWQAFDLRGGVFYEPSQALHRLLSSAYIADDVPIGSLTLPADTLCLIPEPSMWAAPGSYEAIVIFQGDASYSFVTWAHTADATRSVVMDAIQLSLERPERTICELLDEAFREPMADSEEIRQHWRGALAYAIKMLLYLTVRDAHIVHDRAYTNAPRNFRGLGGRKRTARLAEIEQLYDRHVVGPAMLDAEPAAAPKAPTGSGMREMRSHWRRPHFKMQPYGPNASRRKLSFIGPVIVRADRLGE